MDDTGVIGTLLLIITGLTTYKGFRDRGYFEDNLFEVDAILIDKEYKRLLTSAFLHSSWWHFGFNMIALTSFSWSLEQLFGFGKFLLIYFTSLLGGSLLALYIHRNHGDYRAVGASGAISGVIFSSIILFPDAPIKFILIPIEFKGWILGVLFIIISIFGIKNKIGNIGHEAHLGGAITGVMVTMLFVPFEQLNWWVIGALLIPTFIFLILIVNNPSILLVSGYWGEQVESLKRLGREQKPPEPTRVDKQAELDRLLEKISRQGLESLSEKERQRLEQLTREL